MTHSEYIMDHRFVGLRQWGMNPDIDAPCQFPTNMSASFESKSAIDSVPCGKPAYLHKTHCNSSLMIKGEAFPCDMAAPHDGWAHANQRAEAIWGEGSQQITEDQRANAVHGRNRSLEFNVTTDEAAPLRDFMRYLMRQGWIITLSTNLPNSGVGPITSIIEQYLKEKEGSSDE